MFFRQMVVLLHFLEVAGHQQWSGYNSGIGRIFLTVYGYGLWLMFQGLSPQSGSKLHWQALSS